jgi:hypothetical protein
MLAYTHKRQQQTRDGKSGDPARQGATPQRQVDPEELKAGSTGTASLQFGHSFSRIPINPPPIQRKPVSRSKDDEFERETDVMAQPAPDNTAPTVIQRRCKVSEEEEKQTVQTKRMPGLDAGAALNVEAAVNAAGRDGMSLPGDVRSYFEPRFGYDFSKVRVHEGSSAAEGARSIQARAYTMGRDIVFGPGEYAPTTVEGKRLLAHELTHVVQQDGGHAAIPGIQRQPAPPKKPAPKKKTPPFQPRPMTLDDVVKEMTGLGGPYADAKAWAATMKVGKFLGHEIDNGVRPEFQSLLDAAGKKVDEEYKKSGNPIPTGYGIRYIGGFRNEVSPHGAGVAIDIDGGDNPYITHQAGNTSVTAELKPVYHRIAEFILNDPVNGEQSIIPKLITSGESLSGSAHPSRRDIVGEYYDRLAKESDAMHKYFGLMNDDAALKTFLAGDWKKTHPSGTPPAVDDVKKQMWDDYAVLGGAIPKGGPPGISGFKDPPAANRPFHPWRQPQKDPAAGFLTIPREVVLGLGQVVPRWGAIDFGPESGDVMHFDDRYGKGQAFEEAKAPAKAKVDAENQAAKEAFEKAAAAEKEAEEKAAAEKAGEGQGSGSGSGSGSAAPTPQRKAIIGSPNDPLEHQADEVADRVLRMDQPVPVCMGHSPESTPSSHIKDAPGTDRVVSTTERAGSPLPAEERSYFEPRFGYGFGAVRVHADGEAAEAAQGVQARAYTIGRNIVFGSGEYAPATTEGRRLIAHELTHVVQQRSSATSGVVRRKIRPTDVSVELVGQKFSLRKAFSEGAINVPAGEIVTVVTWSDTDSTVQVTSASVSAAYNVPKHLLEPSQTKVAGVSPYGVGLGKFESAVETGAAKLEAFKKTEPEYKTEKGKRFFAQEVSEREAEQKRIETNLNVRLIQASMLNRFDASIKNWVDFYNNQFGFKGKDALDPNLIKAMVYQESQMGTFGDFMSDPATNAIMTRFNILQAIDSWPEEQLLVIPEMMPTLITKYHLENIQQDLLKVETEFDDLKAKAEAGRAKAADITRLDQLKAQSANNWQPWFLAYKAPGEAKGFQDAAVEFLNTVVGGKKQMNDYDFWIRVGIRAVYEKHKSVSSWAEAARAYNGGGPKARKYRDEVIDRAEQAVKAEKGGKEFVPERL